MRKKTHISVLFFEEMTNTAMESESSVTHKMLENVKVWFNDYTALFISENNESIRMIRRKIEHSLDVADNCRFLAKELGWIESEIILSEILGILHDVGQFPKYIDYDGFQNLKLLNHGERGHEIIRRSEILSSLPPDIVTEFLMEYSIIIGGKFQRV